MKKLMSSSRLPNPHIDIGLPSNLREIGGHPMFADVPHDPSVRYQFLCATKTGDEEYVPLPD